MQLRHHVFWPPFLVLLLALGASLFVPQAFEAAAGGANRFVLDHFGWLFNVVALTLLAVCLWALLSPFGSRVIGGPGAAPRLSTWKWFSINLTTSVAIGILFWGPAEPLYHLTAPPGFAGVAANSPGAATNALATMYLHWTFIPYAIYAAPALLFAFAHYNMGQPFSLASILAPLGGGARGAAWTKRIGATIDPICLYALATGMAASLGTGILTMAGGLDHLFGIKGDALLYGLIGAAIVGCYVASAISGLDRGIARVASVSAWTLIGIALYVFLAGPTRFLLNIAVESYGQFLQGFFARALATGAASGDSWPQSWTVFYWAVWMAWAPITAVFLGQIGYGRTVRTFLVMNLVLPALFSVVWMSIFSGTSLHMELIQKAGLAAALTAGGAESAVFAMLAKLPLTTLLVPIFLVTAFLSFVSSADSNTTAMAAISERGITPQRPEPTLRVKLTWGLVVGASAWIMVSFAGIEGVKILSNLGGFPVLFVEIAVCAALVRVIAAPERYDEHDAAHRQAMAASMPDVTPLRPASFAPGGAPIAAELERK